MHAITPANGSGLHGSPQGSERVRSEFYPENPMKTLLVGRHFLIREALCGILRELKSDAVVLEAVDGPEAMRLLAEEVDIGLVILDLDGLHRNGLPELGELRNRHPNVPVVIVSSTQDHDAIVKALNLGAQGFILKSAPDHGARARTGVRRRRLHSAGSFSASKLLGCQGWEPVGCGGNGAAQGHQA